MKTNQNPVQEQPAQPIAPETSATVQSGQPPVPVTEQPNALSLPEHEPELQSAQPAEQLYDPNEAAQIVRHLTDGYFDPEYILLFGKLVGGTP